MKTQYFLFPFIFFPSVNFGLFPAEIFPWAFLVSLFYIKRNLKDYLTIFVIMLPAVVISYINNTDSYEILRSFFAYINVFFIFVSVTHMDDKDLNVLIRVLR